MTYATVMVSLALDRSNDTRLEIAGQLAKRFNVVEIAEDDVHRPAELYGVNDVVAWLSRHGVVASGQAPSECGDVPTQLDRIASELGAGLIIAGAYGHSRLREWVLGGVTKRLVNPSNRCSLLSR